MGSVAGLVVGMGAEHDFRGRTLTTVAPLRSTCRPRGTQREPVTGTVNSRRQVDRHPDALNSPRTSATRSTPEEHLICGVLRGEVVSWPDDADAGFARRLLDACAAEGVGALVHHHARSSPAWHDWPAAVRLPLLRVARMHTALDMLRERELIAVLGAFAGARIDTLLLKGAALAHSHYPEPALRTRCDADVLIRPEDHDAATQLLLQLGYRRPNAVSGTLVSYEECHSKREGTVDHVIDLHWQISNRQVFARALTFDEAYARAVPVPQLGAAARALCAPHALLLACMHRAAHLGSEGPAGNRLVWLYDIHLLANAMTAGEWPDFEAMCGAKAMRRISLDAFICTERAFATAFPDEVQASLAAAGAVELSAAYLDPGRRRLLLTNLRALPTWTTRGTLVRELLFPPADYLLAKYRARSRWLLPWWYVRRAAEGIWKSSRSP